MIPRFHTPMFRWGGEEHAQILIQADNAGMPSYDWRLLDQFLSSYTMQVVVGEPGGPQFLLRRIKPAGGGMVQGLPLILPVFPAPPEA